MRHLALNALGCVVGICSLVWRFNLAAIVTQVAWLAFTVKRKFFDVHAATGSAVAHEALERIGALSNLRRSSEEHCRRYFLIRDVCFDTPTA